jgi:hypothetical protein
MYCITGSTSGAAWEGVACETRLEVDRCSDQAKWGCWGSLNHLDPNGQIFLAFRTHYTIQSISNAVVPFSAHYRKSKSVLGSYCKALRKPLHWFCNHLMVRSIILCLQCLVADCLPSIQEPPLLHNTGLQYSCIDTVWWHDFNSADEKNYCLVQRVVICQGVETDSIHCIMPPANNDVGTRINQIY